MCCAHLPEEYEQLRWVLCWCCVCYRLCLSTPSSCSRLRYLTLTNCELLVLPPVVRGMAGLQLLKLNINRLQAGTGWRC
jgi:hypothetical protein